MKEIILYNLPKISLNQWYAGNHWSIRSKLKNDYALIIKSQYKYVFSKDKNYTVFYNFLFKNKPLDASNCVAMLKMIEDIIFENDGHNVITGIHIQSEKSPSKKDYVKIHIYENRTFEL
jgi:hypothetical protein